MKELLKALAAAKREIGPILKKETNPYFKSKYSDINELIKQVEPILDSHGLMLLQPIEQRNGISPISSVSTRIFHIESGEKVESIISLPELTDPQKIGSAITYYRRYTLQSLLGLQAEDDDGNLAARPETKKTKHKYTRDIAEKAIGDGMTSDQLKKFVDMDNEQIEAYNKMLHEYTKS